MHTLIRLASLAVILGAWLLTPDAASARSYPACEDLIDRACPSPGAMVYCTWEGRYMDALVCSSGSWTYG